MKKITKTILTIAAAVTALSAASCKKDDTLRYNNGTMGNVVNGTFTSDQGNIFNVVEQTCIGKLDTMKRAFVICDVLNQVGNGNEYDVRLNYISNVLTKDAVYSSSITEGNELVNDPIILNSYWVAGGYINIHLSVPIVSNSNVKHYINFLYEDTDQTEGTYTFNIRHDGTSEVFNESNEGQIVLASAYASVPVASIIKEDNAKIILKWLSHKITGNAVSLTESHEVTREILYSRDTYQQIPTEAKMTRSSLDIR